MPIAFSLRRMCRPRLWSDMMVDSVTSTSSRSGDRPVSSRMPWIISARSSRPNCTGDRLTAMLAGILPSAAAGPGRTQRPFAHVDDRLGFLGERNEFGRRDHAELRMFPSHQGFGATDM